MSTVEPASRGEDTVTATGATADRTNEWLWHMDPTQYALATADSRRTEGATEKPPPLCTEAGRRLLRLQFTFSSWVLRRVEKVEFDHDRRVLRRSTIELAVPHDAPELVIDAKHFWLVPLSVLRRRTLVNLDLSDEHGTTVRMLGLRFTQALDESMLRAAAMIALSSDHLPEELELLISDVVSGSREEIDNAKLRVAQARGKVLTDEERARVVPLRLVETHRALRNRLFAATLERLWHNFTLYTLLPVDRGRQRLIRLSVDEPTEWKTQKPNIERSTKRHVMTYKPLATRAQLPWMSMLGWRPVRLRFLTPSAENSASYHFEFTAPPDVRIARATLLAGRPQCCTGDTVGKGVSVDDVTPRGPTVGLHAVEVPNGSLCRVQIDLRVPTSGWLQTMWVAVLACLAVVGSVLFHAWRQGGEADQWFPDQVTNIVLLLVTVSAGSATYVSHNHSHEVAAKMVRALRTVGALAMAVPALVAGGLVYLGEKTATQSWDTRELPFMLLVGAVGVLVLLWLVICVALFSAWGSQLKTWTVSSWDLTGVEPPRHNATETQRNYPEAERDFAFHLPAIGFYTAEGWHERYAWSDSKQQEVLNDLAGEKTRLPDCRCSRGKHPRK